MQNMQSSTRPLRMYATYDKRLTDYAGRFVCDAASSSGGSAGRFLLDRLSLLLQSIPPSKDFICAIVSSIVSLVISLVIGDV